MPTPRRSGEETSTRQRTSERFPSTMRPYGPQQPSRENEAQNIIRHAFRPKPGPLRRDPVNATDVGKPASAIRRREVRPSAPNGAPPRWRIAPGSFTRCRFRERPEMRIRSRPVSGALGPRRPERFARLRELRPVPPADCRRPKRGTPAARRERWSGEAASSQVVSDGPTRRKRTDRARPNPRAPDVRALRRPPGSGPGRLCLKWIAWGLVRKAAPASGAMATPRTQARREGLDQSCGFKKRGRSTTVLANQDGPPNSTTPQGTTYRARHCPMAVAGFVLAPHARRPRAIVFWCPPDTRSSEGRTAMVRLPARPHRRRGH